MRELLKTYVPVALIGRGRRIAIGAEGSGTRVLALQLLTANAIDTGLGNLVDLGTVPAIAAFVRPKSTPRSS